MNNATQQIVNKAWNFAHILPDDGLSYMPYKCAAPGMADLLGGQVEAMFPVVDRARTGMHILELTGPARDRCAEVDET